MPQTRDYSLTGPNAQRAVDLGLVAADWYHTDVPRKVMKDLMQRRDGPALRDTAIWLGAMLVTGGLGVWFWGGWACLPFFLAYGVLYGSASDSRWHECGHGTAFRTAWMNDVVYQVASFMIVRNPVVWRWSHTRHHTDTIIVGRDPEIAVMRPTRILRAFGEFVGVPGVFFAWKAMVLNAFGQLDADARTYVPDSERPKVFRVARVWCAIYLATLGLALLMQSILPLMLIGLPRFYGAWHHVLVGYTQHAGLPENVLDHRLNSRTVHMNPVSRFIYWNMNYHVEHHMFPMVPYHALPRLHAMIRHDLPAAYPSIRAAWAEILPTILRQAREPDWVVQRALPPTAQPYRPDLHGQVAAE